MWRDEIIIGEGDLGFSAVHVFELPGAHSISQNHVSFWVSKCILDSQLKVFKNTPEGQTLVNMIEQRVRLVDIQDWLDRLVLKHMEPEQLKRSIKQAEEFAFQRGRAAKLAEFRQLLEIE